MNPFFKGALIALIPALIIWALIIWAILTIIHIFV